MQININNECVFLFENTDFEKVVADQFGEIFVTALYNSYKDKERKVENDTPLACIITQDEGGNNRHFFFSMEQLTSLINNLNDLRFDLLKETARVIDKRFGIAHPVGSQKKKHIHKSKRKDSNKPQQPFKGNGVLEQLDNLFNDFSKSNG